MTMESVSLLWHTTYDSWRHWRSVFGLWVKTMRWECLKNTHNTQFVHKKVIRVVKQICISSGAAQTQLMASICELLGGTLKWLSGAHVFRVEQIKCRIMDSISRHNSLFCIHAMAMLKFKHPWYTKKSIKLKLVDTKVLVDEEGKNIKCVISILKDPGWTLQKALWLAHILKNILYAVLYTTLLHGLQYKSFYY